MKTSKGIKGSFGIGLSGHIRAEKWSGDGSDKKTYEFDNVVLGVGWDRIWSLYPGRDSAYITPWLFLGTSSVEPTEDDLGLLAISTDIPAKYRHSISEGHSIELSPVKKAYSSMTYRFDYVTEGEAAGTWSELGLAWDEQYVHPLNRALFRDENGDPISVTILANEFFRVWVEVRVHFDMSIKSGSFLFNGNEIQYQAAFNDAQNPGWRGVGSFFQRGFPDRFGLGVGNRPHFGMPTNNVVNWAAIKNNQNPDNYIWFDFDYSARWGRTIWDLPKDFGCTDFSFGFMFVGQSGNAVSTSSPCTVNTFGTSSHRAWVVILFDTPLTKLNTETLSGFAEIQWERWDGHLVL